MTQGQAKVAEAPASRTSIPCSQEGNLSAAAQGGCHQLNMHSSSNTELC